MRFYINDEKVSRDEFYKKLEEAADAVVDEDYMDELIDDTNEEVTVCGSTFSASLIMKELDPIAYRCMRNDAVSSYYSDLEYNFDDCDYEERVNGDYFKTETEPYEDDEFFYEYLQNSDEEERYEIYCKYNNGKEPKNDEEFWNWANDYKPLEYEDEEEGN